MVSPMVVMVYIDVSILVVKKLYDSTSVGCSGGYKNPLFKIFFRLLRTADSSIRDLFPPIIAGIILTDNIRIKRNTLPVWHFLNGGDRS